MIYPGSLEDLQKIIAAHDCILPVCGGSKSALSAQFEEATRVNLGKLAGIVTYEPDEYTVTVQAGTAVATLIDTLAEQGQYLPFDPLLVAAGATIGGTVAANCSGPGRYRYGGVRDFILGVQFVDGRSRLVSGGGKVVKNAAGFDIPKFMTGSLGRYGILTEITFKVFPKPQAYQTLQLTFATINEALNATFLLAKQPFEMDAIEIVPQTNGKIRVLIRLGGGAESLPMRIERLHTWLSSQTALETVSTVEDDAPIWAAINGADWANKSAALVKIPMAPKQLPAFHRLECFDAVHYSIAGNVAWVSTLAIDDLDAALTHMGLVGQQCWGEAGRPYLGQRHWLPFALRIKQALDPHNKFLPA